eukprot:jgi/Mesen1/3911/ME000208S02919
MRRGRKEEGSDDEGPPVKRARSVRKSHIEAETSTRGQIRQRETTTSDEPSKRAKVIDRDKDGYYAGNIIKITCRNFMTYDDMTIIPSPRLNLIIGPNGTGKSSLVCAIGLGLAGEPKSLGRAGSVGDYVQRGKPEAVTEITIRGGAKQEVFKVVRRFNTENKSVWSINGVTKIKEDVKRLCQEYDIQIGNLTQFLPQDRVTEFAKMTPVELLRETEKAVDERLHKQHEELIAMQAALHMLDTTVKQHDTTLGRHKALNAELEKDVERINMREEMLAEMKLPWLIYDRSKEPFRLAREDLQRADRHLESVRQHFEATAGPFREMSKRRDALKREGEEMVRLLKEKDQQRLKAFDKQQAQQRQARLDRAKRELAAVEVELAAEPEHYQPPVEKLCSLRDQINAKRDAIVRLQQDARSISYQQGPKQSELQAIDRRLQELSDTKHRRIRAYNDRDNDLAGMWRFLEDNRSTRLKGPVYGPLLIEVRSLLLLQLPPVACHLLPATCRLLLSPSVCPSLLIPLSLFCWASSSLPPPFLLLFLLVPPHPSSLLLLLLLLFFPPHPHPSSLIGTLSFPCCSCTSFLPAFLQAISCAHFLRYVRSRNSWSLFLPPPAWVCACVLGGCRSRARNQKLPGRRWSSTCPSTSGRCHCPSHSHPLI